VKRRSLVFIVILALSASSGVLAQGKGREGRGGQQMSQEERERLREDLNRARKDVYRDQDRSGGQRGSERDGRMSNEDREKLRRDILDANKDMRRR
jgi:hypothetical protein